MGNKPRSAAVEVVNRTELVALDAMPEPPAHFSTEMVEVYQRMIAGYPPGVLASIDEMNLIRMVELMFERERWSHLVADAPLINVPVRDRQGNEIGQKFVVNPAEAALRRCDRDIDAITDQMCLSPKSRARLGYTVASARLANAEVTRLLGTDWENQ